MSLTLVEQSRFKPCHGLFDFRMRMKEPFVSCDVDQRQPSCVLLTQVFALLSINPCPCCQGLNVSRTVFRRWMEEQPELKDRVARAKTAGKARTRCLGTPMFTVPTNNLIKFENGCTR